MKETRTINIGRKIFKKEDLKSISKIFRNEYQNSYESGNNTDLKFTYRCIDNITIQNESVKVFDEHGLLDMKKTSNVDFTFYDYTDDKYINLNVTHGDYGSNEIKISGDGETWTRHISNLFEDELEAIKPQSNFFKHQYIIGAVLSCITAGTICFYITKITGIPLFKKNETPSEAGWIVSSFYLMGSVIVIPLFTWLIKLWPAIEFDFGPEHMKYEKQKKIRLWIVLSVVIIPIILSKFI